MIGKKPGGWGGGCCLLQALYEKRGEGGGGVLYASGMIRKVGEGRLLCGRGEGILYARSCNPQHPPTLPHPPGSAYDHTALALGEFGGVVIY